jgi:hypothetical protein
MAKLTVILLGKELVTQDEDNKAGAAITPGMLLTYNGSGDLIPHGTAGGNTPKYVALEREEFAQTMNVNYAIGDTVKAGACPTGVRVNLILPTGQTIAKGALLESAGNGKVRILATGVALFQALEAVTNASGSDVRIRGMAL